MMQINGVHISTYRAKLEDGYSIAAMPVSNTVQRGRNRTSFILASQAVDMKAINFSLFFECESARELMMCKSQLDGACTGTVELFMPDGFFYRSVLHSAGALELVGQVCGRADYAFKGIQHDALKTVKYTGTGILIHGSAPTMDARLTVTVRTAGTEYQLAGAVFDSVEEGDVLCFDGLNNVITKNGINAADECTFLSFPKLTPGINTIDCRDTVTVEYFPVYM